MPKSQSLTEIFKITERKDGCVFRTKSVGFAWITFGHKPEQDGNLIYGAVSTKLMVELNYRTLRTVADETPDFCIVSLAELRSK